MWSSRDLFICFGEYRGGKKLESIRGFYGRGDSWVGCWSVNRSLLGELWEKGILSRRYSICKGKLAGEIVVFLGILSSIGWLARDCGGRKEGGGRCKGGFCVKGWVVKKFVYYINWYVVGNYWIFLDRGVIVSLLFMKIILEIVMEEFK